jgi:hypothetical protein
MKKLGDRFGDHPAVLSREDPVAKILGIRSAYSWLLEKHHRIVVRKKLQTVP